MDNYNKLWATIRNTDLLNNDEKIELQLYLFNLNEQVKKQKEINQKAIEYIKEHKHLNWYVESCYTNDLLQILEDKEVLKNATNKDL